MKTRLSCLLVLLASMLCLRASSPDVEFSTANAAYTAGKFTEAKQGYETLIGNGDFAANLFYNLGNAEWRLHEAGRATLAYERALAIQPNAPEARANLAFVQKQTGSRLFPAKSWEVIFPSINLSTLAWALVLAIWVALLSLLALWLRWMQDGTWAGLAVVVALLAAAYFGAAIVQGEKRMHSAIVVAAKVDARYAPADNSPLADTLPAGSEVRILQNSGEWTYCLLPGEIRAWLPTAAIESISPAHA
ncbi:MAG: hypothetical protein QM796_03315 [Chthoniobacteraceae bacterium]